LEKLANSKTWRPLCGSVLWDSWGVRGF
jgi:hypothetical protein